MIRKWINNRNGTWSLIKKKYVRSWFTTTIKKKRIETITQEEYFKRKLAGNI